MSNFAIKRICCDVMTKSLGPYNMVSPR